MDFLGSASDITIHYISTDFNLDYELVETLRNRKQTIYRIRPDVIVKRRSYTTRTWTEAKNMIFIANSTSVPVPKVFAVLTHGPLPDPMSFDWDQGGKKAQYLTYILMEVVPGATLEDVWEDGTAEVKQALSTKLSVELQGYINQLREIPGGTYIGSLGNGPIVDTRFRKVKDRGPFATESGFNAAIQEAWTEIPGSELMSERLDKSLEAHEHEIKFTHGDLHFSNIMINDGHISGIIDWEFAGWYPIYWEYICAVYMTKPDRYWETFWENAIEKPHSDILEVIEKLDKALMF